MVDFLDVCRFTAASSGTADFVVSAAVQGYQTPASAAAIDGVTYRYRAESADLSQWEIGYGPYTVSGTTLARTTVVASTNGGAKVNFTNPPNVSIVALTQDLRPLTVFEGRNRLINGAMAIDQRNAGGSLAVTAGTPQYTVDRWAGLSANPQCTIQRIATGNLDFPYALRLKRASASVSTAAIQIAQVIESVNCQDLSGLRVTLSFYATAGANFSGTNLNVVIGTGSVADEGAAGLFAGTWTTNGSTSSTVAPTTTRQLFSLTGTIPAGTKEIGARLYWTPSGTAGANDYVDITGVQLEIGPQANLFRRRQFAEELLLCQRYCTTSFPVETAPANNVSAPLYNVVTYSAGAFAAFGIPFPAQLRANPTVTFYSSAKVGVATGQWQYFDGTAWRDGTGTALSAPASQIFLSVSYSYDTVHATAYFGSGHFVATAEL